PRRGREARAGRAVLQAREVARDATRQVARRRPRRASTGAGASEYPGTYAADAVQAHRPQVSHLEARIVDQVVAELVRHEDGGGAREVDEAARQIDGRPEEVAFPRENGSAREADADIRQRTVPRVGLD